MTDRNAIIRQCIGIDLIILAGWLGTCLSIKPSAWMFAVEAAALIANTVIFLIRMTRLERNER